MIQINQTVRAERVSPHAIQIVLIGENHALLQAQDVAALREVLTGEGVGGCQRCGYVVLTANECQRQYVYGLWQWCCPSCRLPLTPFPF
jgi:hypothetical protein